MLLARTPDMDPQCLSNTIPQKMTRATQGLSVLNGSHAAQQKGKVHPLKDCRELNKHIAEFTANTGICSAKL